MAYRKIIRLDPNTIKRIAAGEVVTRPANVVKELVENSLDAEATKVSISIKNGGKTLIEVVDNGTGIPPEEVELAFELHTTSKVYSPDDLNHLITYGFRGEALASIAAVSIVEIWTTYKDNNTGVYLLLEGGTIKEKKEIHRKRGTTIRVRDLFFNTPARRKFMKTDTTERSHIVNVVTSIALARPEIQITLTEGTRNIINAPPRKTLHQRLYDIFGPNVATHFIELNPSPIFKGYITDPEFKAKDKSMQYFMVNKRPITSLLLSNALKTGYGTFLMTRQYPGGVIHVELPPEEIDVNIHPAKLEVRFKNEEKVFEELKQIVWETLKEKTGARIIPEAINETNRVIKKQSSSSIFATKSRISSRSSFPAEEKITFNKKYSPQQPTSERKKQHLKLDFQSTLSETQTVTTKPIHHSLPGNIRLLAQIFKKYFIAETEGEMILIDMHAAHERLNYEKNLKILNQKATIQKLLQPIVLDLPPTHLAEIENKKIELQTIGFEFYVENNKVHITGLPGIFPAKIGPDEILEILLEVLSNSLEKTEDREHFQTTEEYLKHLIAAKTACFYSLRAGDQPTLQQFARILAELRTCEKPLICAHGRPVIIRFPETWLDRKFHRIT